MAGFELSIPDLSKAVSKISSLTTKLDVAAQFGVGQVGLAVERKARNLLTNNQHADKVKNGKHNWTPRGHIGGDGTPPNRRTGNLIRSIYTDLKHEPGSYVASVFPTALYGRALELGNPKWKSGVKYPYMKPAFDFVKPQATRIFEKAFAKKMVI
jgi:hypothetical protein